MEFKINMENWIYIESIMHSQYGRLDLLKIAAARFFFRVKLWYLKPGRLANFT